MALTPFPVQKRDRADSGGDARRRPEALVNRTFDLDAGDRDLIELLHEQTRCHRNSARRRGRIIGQFLWDAKTIVQSTRLREASVDEVALPLPEPTTPSAGFADVLGNRSSGGRGGLGVAFDLGQLSTLLHLAIRSNRTVRATAAPEACYHFRPYPSPGGLYPGEVYVLAARVEGLAAKPYRYDARHHTLIDFGASDGGFGTVETAGGHEVPACVLAITSVINRATAKYGARGYRLSLIEAGHIGQNLTLAAGAIGLRSLVYGSFFDAEFEHLLGVDGLNEVLLSSVLVGGPS